MWVSPFSWFFLNQFHSGASIKRYSGAGLLGTFIPRLGWVNICGVKKRNKFLVWSMDVVRSQRGSSRDTSPDRAKICRMNQKVKPFRKVQVVYYLSRNGLLEHPHFMELTLLPNQPLRLKGNKLFLYYIAAYMILNYLPLL